MRQRGVRGVELRPVGLSAAVAMVGRWHRHLPRCAGGLAAVEVVGSAGWPVGVAIVGRPSSRVLAGRGWVEVVRVALAPLGGGPLDCPWGAASACYQWAEAWAWWGGRPVLTYTLGEESGGSLRAAGWREAGQTRGGQWACPSRARTDRNESLSAPKRRWAPGWALDMAQLVSAG